MRKDKLIDRLIVPPRVIFSGGGWDQTHKLRPNGDADKDHVLAEVLQPASEVRDA